jgi:hypothetical protein
VWNDVGIDIQEIVGREPADFLFQDGHSALSIYYAILVASQGGDEGQCVIIRHSAKTSGLGLSNSV